MKRFGQFMLLFLGFMVVAYALPVMFPKEESVIPAPKEEKADVTVSHTSFPYGELKAAGFADYIDQPTEEFTKVYGEPIEIQQTAFGYNWWILGENEHDYLQVAVKNNKIISVFALGDELPNDPFEIGMTLSDISEITTIYPNFDFDKKDVNYRIELSEEDMNYRPLVAFDNGSFAILHLTQETGKLIGVRYLNKSTLLRLKPYQLNAGILAESVVDQETDWELVNLDSQRQLQSILTILRQRGKYEPYDYPKELTDVTQKALLQFMNEPNKVLTDKERLTEWQENKNHYDFDQPFKLSPAEFSRVLETAGLTPKDYHGILYTPSYDVPFLMMTWYSQALTQTQFTHKKDREVGIAFYQDVVLFVFSERPVEPEMTTSDLSESSSLMTDSLEQLSSHQ